MNSKDRGTLPNQLFTDKIDKADRIDGCKTGAVGVWMLDVGSGSGSGSWNTGAPSARISTQTFPVDT